MPWAALSCEGRIAYLPDGTWHCTTGCGLAQPVAHARLETTPSGPVGVWADGRRLALALDLPGRFNRGQRIDGRRGGRSPWH